MFPFSVPFQRLPVELARQVTAQVVAMGTEAIKAAIRAAFAATEDALLAGCQAAGLATADVGASEVGGAVFSGMLVVGGVAAFALNLGDSR